MNANLQSSTVTSSRVSQYLSWKDLDRTSKSVTWLWDGWIPDGFLTMIVGAPSSGKSFFALALVRTLLHGGEWPDGISWEANSANSSVLWIETEGGEALNTERAAKLGIDLSRIVTIHTEESHGQPVDFGNKEILKLILERAQDEKTVLIVIDSLSGGHSENENETSAGKVVQKLAQIASCSGKPVLLIHHTNKAAFKSSDPHMADARGSGSQLQYPRIVLNVDTPSSGPVRRVTCTKNNFRERPNPFGFRFVGDGLEWCEAPTVDQASILAEKRRKQRDEEIIRLSESGRTQREIADEVGCSVGTVNNVLSAHHKGRATLDSSG